MRTLGGSNRRREPDSDSPRVEVDLWPTAYRFPRGHRLRVQIAGGAFPRWNRNPGTREPLGESTTLLPADRRVFHDPDRPSAISIAAEKRG